MTHHGLPCWYELTTANPNASKAFFGSVLDWGFADAPMPGFTYILARSGEDMVAGLYAPEAQMPQFWMVYFAVNDCDATVAQIRELGGAVHQEPADIPGTGRFAIVTDPQGAAFGLLQPLAGQSGTAFAPMKAGHGCWHQLETPDPVAALAFYAKVLGWAEARQHDMGAMGPYRIIAAQGQDMGGIMAPLSPETPAHWLPFFGTDSVAATLPRVTAAGGKVLAGPHPVPGGAFIANIQDDQGIAFAVVGGA